MSRTTQAILRIRDEQALFQEICDIAAGFGAFSLAWIGLVAAGGGEVRVMAQAGPARHYLDGLEIRTGAGAAPGRGPVVTALREGTVQVVNDFLNDPRTGPSKVRAGQFEIGACAALPIFRSGRATGTLTLYAGQPGFFTPENLTLLGEIAGCLSYALDDLDREAALRATAQAVRKISVAVEQGPVTVVITDLQGDIEYVNPKFTELTGYAAAEVQGRNPRFLQSGRVPPGVYRAMWAALAAGETWKGEFQNRKKNGELFWEAATIAPIRDGEGAVTHYVAVKEDITALKSGEAARIESEARFQQLFETSNDGIALEDLVGRYQDCNQAFLDLLGLDGKDALLGRSCDAVTAPESLDLGRRMVAACRELPAGRNLAYEKEYLRADGTRVPAEVHLWVRRDREGAPVGLWCIARDITERRQADQALEQLNGELEERIRRRTALLETALAELDAFSYSVSHDLRAPLRGIDGFSQALQEECGELLSAEGRHYLQRVRAGTQRMGRLIDDLLKLSQVSRSALNRQPLDLSALAEALLDELDQGDPGRGLELRVAPGLEASGDPGLVRAVLGNLLGNAWKYTARASAPRIEVFREPLPDGGAAFCVRDNGVGFDMAYAGKLFMAFQRLHSATDFEGSGIGLAIVQRIIHRHGGQVWARSAEGEGASFYFTLPGQP